MHCGQVIFEKILQLMIWKKRIKRKTKIFYVDRHPSGIRNILDIHRYLMKEA